MITYTKPILINEKMSFPQSLVAGESWEQWLVEKLNNEVGISCYRPNQLALYNCALSIFAKQQRDVHVKIPNTVRRLVVEVKSRNEPFGYPTIDVGAKRCWDSKMFPVYSLAVICQISQTIKFTPADKETREKSWKVRKNKDVCYSVPRSLFQTFEEWINNHSYLVNNS